MIAESPAPGCTHGAASAARRMMARARASIIRACGQPPRHFFAIIAGLATVTGVGFFDFWHGQRGVAPNAIELHPVLGFEAGSCREAP